MKITPGNVLFIALVGYTGMSGAMLVNHMLQRRQATPTLRVVDVPSWRQYADSGHALGPASSSTTVVIFSDFQCPFCRRFSHVVDSLHAEFPAVRFVERHFPLDALHPAARHAALAAECATDVGKYPEMRRSMFDHARLVADQKWGLLAVEAGIADTEQLVRCVNTTQHAAIVERDVTAGSRLGVEGTPTVLIDGQMYPDGPPSRQEIETVIRRDGHSR